MKLPLLIAEIFQCTANMAFSIYLVAIKIYTNIPADVVRASAGVMACFASFPIMV